MMETKEWRFIDKSDWGDGLWDREVDKLQWEDEATKLPCLIVRNGFVTGALCGYVGVSKDHPWFGKSYSDLYDEDLFVHGGLTYSDFCVEDDKETGICHVSDDGIKRYWFGFDCAHAGDLCPKMQAREKKMGWPTITAPWDTSYKTIEYVKGQCIELARQIKAAAK